MTTKNIKKTLGENTEKLEKFWIDNSSYYTNLEPWQRGTLIIALTLLLVLATYYLTRENKEKAACRKTEQEAMMEARIIKRMELLKKLRE